MSVRASNLVWAPIVCSACGLTLCSVCGGCGCAALTCDCIGAPLPPVSAPPAVAVDEEPLEKMARLRQERACEQGPHFQFARKNGSWWCYNPFSSKVYRVSETSCSCPDHSYRTGPAGLPCKHVLALRAKLARLDRAA